MVSSRDGSGGSGGDAASSRQLTGGSGGGGGPSAGAVSSRQLTGGDRGPSVGPRRLLRRGSGGTSTPSGSMGRRCAPPSPWRLLPFEPLRGLAGAVLASVLRPSLGAVSVSPAMGLSMGLSPTSASAIARRALERPRAGARPPSAG